jgi:hypothetical protein
MGLAPAPRRNLLGWPGREGYTARRGRRRATTRLPGLTTEATWPWPSGATRPGGTQGANSCTDFNPGERPEFRRGHIFGTDRVIVRGGIQNPELAISTMMEGFPL